MFIWYLEISAYLKPNKILEGAVQMVGRVNQRWETGISVNVSHYPEKINIHI
jgi:hypothetical protein